MYRIIDKRGNGKTSRLMLLAKENNGIVVCANPDAMRVKAQSYGFDDIEFISYWTYIEDTKGWNATRKPIFIDELENFTMATCGKITGYSLTNED